MGKRGLLPEGEKSALQKSYNPGHKFFGHLSLCKSPPLPPSTKLEKRRAVAKKKTQSVHRCEGGKGDASKCLNMIFSEGVPIM